MAAALPAWVEAFSDLHGVAELAADCTAFLAHRQSVLGIDGAGLYNFYAQRVASGQLFALYDLQVARFCSQKLRAFDTFVEVGCGVGLLPFLIGQQGQKCIGIENDWKRAACAGDMKLHLVDHYPLIAANARIMYGGFPAALPNGVDKDRSVLLCTCLVFTHTPAQALAFIREMRTYPMSIIDLTRFLKIRREPALRQELLDQLEDEGFDTPAPLGPINSWDGEFVALTPRR